MPNRHRRGRGHRGGRRSGFATAGKRRIDAAPGESAGDGGRNGCFLDRLCPLASWRVSTGELPNDEAGCAAVERGRVNCPAFPIDCFAPYNRTSAVSVKRSSLLSRFAQEGLKPRGRILRPGSNPRGNSPYSGWNRSLYSGRVHRMFFIFCEGSRTCPARLGQAGTAVPLPRRRCACCSCVARWRLAAPRDGPI